MSIILLVISVIVFISIMLNRVFKKLGIPILLSFIALGMIFGSEGIFKIQFSDYNSSETICTIALIFIMFYGGFGTNWKKAKKIGRESILMSSVGVILTALFVLGFSYYICKMDFKSSFLMGAVVSSTDAASVFSVLKSKRLSLKYRTASLLEVESGSNDPFSYMLTIIGIELFNGKLNTGRLILMASMQLIFGIAVGFLVAYLAVYLLRKINMKEGGFDLAFIIGVAVFSFALADALGGNGYLATYLTGIIMGNKNFRGKTSLVKSLEGISSLTQILIFFLLGLLVYPTNLIQVPEKTLAIALFLVFIARPITVFILMYPFKMKLNQKLLIAFSGLRGASAIVFSIMVVNRTGSGELIFDTTFAIVLLSIIFQGSLLPLVSKKLNMIDEEEDVLKTFNDYMEEIPIEFITMKIPEKHSWIGCTLSQVNLPPEILVIIVMRGKRKIVPNGNTKLKANDQLILSAMSSKLYDGIKLFEMEIDIESGYIGKKISQLNMEKGELVILIKRKNQVIIPKGSDILMEGDVLVLNQQQ